MDETHSILLSYLFCCKFTQNDQILDLLEDLATKKQKCPPINSNLEKYGSNYHLLYSDVLRYFKMSARDKPNRVAYKNWSSIRKKRIKEVVLKKYIFKVKNTFCFDDQTLERLSQQIMTGIHFKTVNDKNIVMFNCEIAEIKGLNLSINHFTWDFDIVAV